MRVTHVLEDAYRDRSEGVRRISQKFDYDTITNPDQKQVAMTYARLAAELLRRVTGDNDEFVIALHHLIESRNAMIESMIVTRAATAIGLDL